MIWIAIGFILVEVGSRVVDVYVYKQKVAVREYFASGVLLSLTLFASVLVSWGLWPELDPLILLKKVFTPLTMWLYG